MRYVFHPGCTLNQTHKELSERVADYLKADLHTVCCQKSSFTPPDAVIITACPACELIHRRNSAETVTLWELIPDDFNFPDYSGLELSIHDPCKVRRKTLFTTIRKLLERMNIVLREPAETGGNAPCCEYWGRLEKMKRRVEEMPVNRILVYCTGCYKGMASGGGEPVHMIDLLFGDGYG
jgi:Fe-S oxidoreductase